MKRLMSIITIITSVLVGSSLFTFSSYSLDSLPVGIEKEIVTCYNEYSELRAYNTSMLEYINDTYGEDAVYTSYDDYKGESYYILDEQCKIHHLEIERYNSVTMKPGCYPPVEKIIEMGIGKPYIDANGEQKLVFSPFYQTIGSPENVFGYNFDNYPCGGVSNQELEELEKSALSLLESDDNVISIGTTELIKNMYTSSFAVELYGNCRNDETYEMFYNEFKDDLYLVKHDIENGYNSYSFELKYGTFDSPEMYEAISKLFKSNYTWKFTLGKYIHWDAGYIPTIDELGEQTYNDYKNSSFLEYYTEQNLKESNDQRYLNFCDIEAGDYKQNNEFGCNVGDLNLDEKVDISDLSELSLALIGDRKLSEAQQKAADVDKDGKVTLSDLARMRQYLSKVITSFG